MKITKILDKAEGLDHNQRWKYMIGLGRASKNDLALAKMLKELAFSGIHYERILSLMSAHGSFDEEIIVRLLEDPSAVGMSSAIRLAAKHLDSNLLISMMPELSKSKRLGLAAAILAERRTDIIECIYNKSNAFEQQRMLLYISESFFKENIDEEKLEVLGAG